MSITIERGSADSLSKTAMVWGLPSSSSSKLSFVSPAMGAPCSSVTVTNTFTSLTFTLNVVSGSCTELAVAGFFAGADPPEAQGGLGTCPLHNTAAAARKVISFVMNPELLADLREFPLQTLRLSSS
jgi:hypothetical protein